MNIYNYDILQINNYMLIKLIYYIFKLQLNDLVTFYLVLYYSLFNLIKIIFFLLEIGIF
jgi:hypothetical protein